MVAVGRLSIWEMLSNDAYGRCVTWFGLHNICFLLVRSLIDANSGIFPITVRPFAIRFYAIRNGGFFWCCALSRWVLLLDFSTWLKLICRKKWLIYWPTNSFVWVSNQLVWRVAMSTEHFYGVYCSSYVFVDLMGARARVCTLTIGLI